MANCLNVDNTTMKGTSAVSYDGTPLPCTDVNTCDNLNTIIDKFNNVLCTTVANVEILTEDIINLTEDVMIIMEEIIDINEQINICCSGGTTTSTSTSTSTTTSTTTTPPSTTTTTSSSSTTTSTSSSSTTTTTTTATPTTTTTTTDPYYYYLSNLYFCPDCFYIVGSQVAVKSLAPLTVGNWYSNGTAKYNITGSSAPNYMSATLDSATSMPTCDCPATTTTTTTDSPTTTTTTTIEPTTTTTTTVEPTTTTTTTACPCVDYVSINAADAGTFNYTDCFGTPKSVFITAGPNVFIGLDDSGCLNRNSISATVSFTVEAFGPCCTPTASTTTTTTTAAGKFVYVTNSSTSGMVTAYNVEIDAISLALDSGSFPLTAGQNLTGQSSNTSATASVFISFVTPTDSAINTIDSYGNSYCVTSPGNETITLDFSGPGSVSINIGEQGSACV